MKKLKVVTIGGGSSYTPELLDGFIKRYHELPVSELWLVDVEEGQAKLDIIFALCQRMVAKAGVPMTIHKSLNRQEALQNADFVTTQFRVGQLKAREQDERIPLSQGYLGQETNGAGGLFKGLRTIPVILDIVQDVQNICPQAWIINFTNPAGMVTEAVYRYTDFKRFIGVCNVPIGMRMLLEDLLALTKQDDVSLDLFGLNHLVFIRDVWVNGQSRFAEVMERVASGTIGGSSVKNIYSLPFSEGLLRSLNLLPCSYLLYYFKHKEMLAIEIGEYYKGNVRAQIVQKLEKQLFEIYKNPQLDTKPAELEARGGAYYSDAACEVINAIYNDKQTEHYINVPHHGHIDNIPADWAVEMTCLLGKHGATPHPRITHFDEKVLGLIHTIKAFEIAASHASLSGQFNDILLALNLNPLVNSDLGAEVLAREMLLANQQYLPQFADAFHLFLQPDNQPKDLRHDEIIDC
ncbi:6-phospho-beta-glucosidase [Citrobacter braakii]|uniref:6-phospho-beta-glucosidase n=1 Tax=Citrobacter braakii TaxID=57706 RepID=UPI0019040CB9|nr:6-phospho-beta-glucosidase [Citrobacter braakii]MBJ9536093.1 6-phospho-beta-glucosidase [Citrobacter braakii]MBJ9584988.1 6-phospho-beta-glucosidase [Citrobacter braakii]